jgi:hypothetical protein
MSLLKSLKTEDGVKIADDKDVLGGGSNVVDSDAYAAKIVLAYIKKSDSGALGLHLVFNHSDNKELRQTLFMTSGDKKGNKTYYTKGDENFPLPGFSQANSLALLTTGKEISDLDTEEKVIKLYDFTAKAEIPTKVQMITEMLDQDIVIGLIRQIVDKTKKNEVTNEYEPTGETREENEIDKFFCAKEGHMHKTTTEIKAKSETAEFYAAWTEKWRGQVRNKAKGAGANAGVPGAPKAAAAAGTPKPKSSLFG